MQINNNLSNRKKQFKKLLLSICMFCLVAVCHQTNCYPHIPLKGLFEVLKTDDIGFGHAILHSKWIENVYQYGAGKPHRKVPIKNGKSTSCRAEYKDDAIANLVRKFWFRKSEDHQLLPTKLGCLAKIPNDKLGSFFGKIINYILRGLPSELENILIDELLGYDFQGKQFQRDLTALFQELDYEENKLKNRTFSFLQRAHGKLQLVIQMLEKRYKMTELNQALKALPQVNDEWGERKFKRGELKKEKQRLEKLFDKFRYVKTIEVAKKDIFGALTKGKYDEYQKIVKDIKKIESEIDKIIKKKRSTIKKILFTPICQAFQLCSRGDVYIPRTTEGIVWALFFHKLNGLITLDEKIAAINDCIKEIDDEYKKRDFVARNGLLKDTYNQKDYDKFHILFNTTQKNLNVDTEAKIMHKCYDIGLHYFINCVVGGNFPPVIPEGVYRYEYEEGKVSFACSDCHETAIMDAFSMLWYNPAKKAFDNSLFSKKVIDNGEGFKRLREALKYFYLADQKGIKANEYTCEYKNKKFTSLAKLKKLGKITFQEIQALDISEIPVSYIISPEIKQEFFNIVSDIKDVIYCSDIEGNAPMFEIKSDASNIVPVWNYFYGTKAKTIAQLGDRNIGLSTKSRKIKCEHQRGENGISDVTISVCDNKNGTNLTMSIYMSSRHTFLSVPTRENTDISDSPLGKTIVDLSDDKFFNMYALMVFRELLENKKDSLSLPVLNLFYYSLMMKNPEVAFVIIYDILRRQPENYKHCKGLIQNLIEKLSSLAPRLNFWLAYIMIRSKLYNQETLFQEFVLKALEDENFYTDAAAKKVLQVALKKGYRDIALAIISSGKFEANVEDIKNIFMIALRKRYKQIALAMLTNEKFCSNLVGVEDVFRLILALGQEFKDIALAIVNNEKFDLNWCWVKKILSDIKELLVKNPEDNHWMQEVIDAIEERKNEKELYWKMCCDLVLPY